MSINFRQEIQPGQICGTIMTFVNPRLKLPPEEETQNIASNGVTVNDVPFTRN